MLKLALTTAATISTASAELKPGACPVREQNKKDFDKHSMAGLWFEYVWDTGFAHDYGYKCATWIVLNDEADNWPGKYLIYNNMLFETDEDVAED